MPPMTGGAAACCCALWAVDAAETFLPPRITRPTEPVSPMPFDWHDFFIKKISYGSKQRESAASTLFAVVAMETCHAGTVVRAEGKMTRVASMMFDLELDSSAEEGREKGVGEPGLCPRCASMSPCLLRNHAYAARSPACERASFSFCVRSPGFLTHRASGSMAINLPFNLAQATYRPRGGSPRNLAARDAGEPARGHPSDALLVGGDRQGHLR